MPEKAQRARAVAKCGYARLAGSSPVCRSFARVGRANPNRWGWEGGGAGAEAGVGIHPSGPLDFLS